MEKQTKKYKSEAEKYSKILELLANMKKGEFINVTNLSRNASINPTEQGKSTYDLLESAKEVLKTIIFLRTTQGDLKGFQKIDEDEEETLENIHKEIKEIKSILKKDE